MANKLTKNLYRLLTPLFLQPVTTFDWEKRILIIRDDGIGDFLLFTGVLQEYIQAFQNSEVYLVVSKEVYPIGCLYMPPDKIIAVDKNRYYYDFTYRKQFLSQLRSIGFKTVIGSIHSSSICTDLVFHVSGKNRYGYEGERFLGGNKKLFVYNHQIRSFDKDKEEENEKITHVICHEWQMLQGVTGLNYNLADIEPYSPQIYQDSLIETLPQDYIVFLPETGNSRRTYPADRLLGILDEIGEQYDTHCVIVGIDTKSDIAAFRQPRFSNLIGQTSLLQSLSIISRAKLVVGNETGLTHFAWIMGVQTIMLYGGGHYGRFDPLKPTGQIICKKLDCYKCNWKCNDVDPDKHIFRCVDQIPLDEIKAFIIKSV